MAVQRSATSRARSGGRREARRLRGGGDNLGEDEGEHGCTTRTGALIRSADGSYLYYAGDVAYVLNKFGRRFDRLIYVLGGPTTTATWLGSRPPRRCSATTPIASRC